MAKGYCDKCGKFIKRKHKKGSGLCRECYLSPGYHEQRCEDVRQTLQDPEVQRRRAEGSKAAWDRGAYDTEAYHKKRSEAAKAQFSDPEAHRRTSEGVRAAWQRGDFDTGQCREKKSKAMKVKWQEPEYREKLLAARKDPQIRKRISKSRKANWLEPEYRKQQLTSHRASEYRRALSERATTRWTDLEERQKQSERALVIWADPEQRAARTGENHYNWQGGISFEPYGLEWTKELRHYVRKRDSHICALCGKQAKSVHHLDYDKTNNDPSNLITLCKPCHARTNHNRRFWRTILAPVAKRREVAWTG